MKPADREPFLPPRDTKKMDDPPDLTGIPDPTERGRKGKDERGGVNRGDENSNGDGFEPRRSKDPKLRRGPQLPDRD